MHLIPAAVFGELTVGYSVLCITDLSERSSNKVEMCAQRSQHCSGQLNMIKILKRDMLLSKFPCKEKELGKLSTCVWRCVTSI